jgi:hypothetical protein
MQEIISRCGYRCDLCPAYEPNIKSLDGRKRVSAGWLKYFGFRTSPEEIGCVGCLNEGKQAYEGCPVRPCVLERGLLNCAYCSEFGCDTLRPIMDFAEQLAERFKDMPEEDYEMFVRPYEGRERLLRIRDGS